MPTLCPPPAIALPELSTGAAPPAAFARAMQLGERIWEVVRSWDAFSRDAVGRPWMRAADAVAARLSGMLDAPDPDAAAAARRALQETSTWMLKARSRGLLDDDAYRALRRELGAMAAELSRATLSLRVRSMRRLLEADLAEGCAARPRDARGDGR